MRAELPTETQISDLEVAVVVNEDVCRLKVTVHNALLVHVLKGASDLVDVLDDLALREEDLVSNCLLDDQLEVALLGPLDCNEELIELAVNEPADVLDDVRAI